MSDTVEAVAAAAALGGVTIEAGSLIGKIEASEVYVAGAASVTMRASQAGSGGLFKLEKSAVSATGDVSLEASSSTEVKDNTLTSGTLVRVASGGSCTAEPNSFSAPVVEACP